MNRLWWIFLATVAARARTKQLFTWRECWEVAANVHDNLDADDDRTPSEAVNDELDYWNEG